MLDESQKNAVAQWFQAGNSLDDIQKRIKSEFGISITYLDLRLLVAELPQPKEPEPPAETKPENDKPAEGNAEKAQPPKRYDLDSPDADNGEAQADVVVELDALTIPGTYASGDVTFTDGTKGKWYLDQQGRLGLADCPEGFRPTPQDAALFQSRLMELLRSRGLA